MYQLGLDGGTRNPAGIDQGVAAGVLEPDALASRVYNILTERNIFGAHDFTQSITVEKDQRAVTVHVSNVTYVRSG